MFVLDVQLCLSKVAPKTVAGCTGHSLSQGNLMIYKSKQIKQCFLFVKNDCNLLLSKSLYRLFLPAVVFHRNLGTIGFVNITKLAVNDRAYRTLGGGGRVVTPSSDHKGMCRTLGYSYQADLI